MTTMDQAMMGIDPNFEQALMSHVEMCYSVALALTKSPKRAAELARETLSWAWQSNGGAWDAHSMKMALMSDLRDRYLHHDRIARHRPASRRQQLQEVGA